MTNENGGVSCSESRKRGFPFLPSLSNCHGAFYLSFNNILLGTRILVDSHRPWVIPGVHSVKVTWGFAPKASISI